MTTSEDRKSHTRSVNELLDQPRSWVRTEVRLLNGTIRRSQSIEVERLFFGTRVTSWNDPAHLHRLGERAAAEAAIAGLRELADQLERQLREIYL